MPITIQGFDGASAGGGAGSPSSRDVDGSADNFVFGQFTLTLSGSYPTGGDTLDLTQIASFMASGLGLPGAPNLAAFLDGSGPSTGWYAGGNYAALVEGSALNNWKVKFFNAGGTELAAGAYPASVLADHIRLYVSGRKLQ